jgi:hypothetical protein
VLSVVIRHGRGYCTANLLGLLDDQVPRTVLTSVTIWPSSDAGEPAPSVAPAGAPAGTKSLTVVGGVVAGASVMPVTARAAVRARR